MQQVPVIKLCLVLDMSHFFNWNNSEAFVSEPKTHSIKQ